MNFGESIQGKPAFHKGIFTVRQKGDLSLIHICSAAFSGPQDLAVDKNGVIYVYDKKNNVIRKIVYE